MNAFQPAQKPWVVVVGGFLGAGKTNLILAADRVLAQKGLRSAVILKDQGDELVDTRYAEKHGLPSREITGGCFLLQVFRPHSCDGQAALACA